MNINLEAFGVTRESLTKAILGELDLTPEQAVVALANELGVEVMDARDYKPEAADALSNGAEVLTTEGAARAAILSEAEINTLRESAAIQTRLFS